MVKTISYVGGCFLRGGIDGADRKPNQCLPDLSFPATRCPHTTLKLTVSLGSWPTAPEIRSNAQQHFVNFFARVTEKSGGLCCFVYAFLLILPLMLSASYQCEQVYWLSSLDRFHSHTLLNRLIPHTHARTPLFFFNKHTHAAAAVAVPVQSMRGRRVSQPDELYLNLVLEFVPETVYSVARQYHKNKQTLPVLLVKLYLYQLARALAHIHALGICHRDIKPQNLLLDPQVTVSIVVVVIVCRCS